MEDARDRLAAERLRTAQRVIDLTGDFDSMVSASRDTNADDEHDPEGSTIAFERSQLAALIGQARRHLEEVDAAVLRLQAGSYGRCETCGEPIPRARLEARPTAYTCVRCAVGTS